MPSENVLTEVLDSYELLHHPFIDDSVRSALLVVISRDHCTHG